MRNLDTLYFFLDKCGSSFKTGGNRQCDGMEARNRPKSVPMRLVCVIDVSHSMSEPYGPDDDVSKLEKVNINTIIV